MRKSWLIALAAAASLLAGGVWLACFRETSLQAARRRLAANDLRGAVLYLNDAVRAAHHREEAEFLLGRTDLILGAPVPAERELKLARQDGDEAPDIVPLLGRAMLEQQNDAAALASCDPAQVAPEARAACLAVQATALLGLRRPAEAAAAAAAALAASPADPAVQVAAARVAMAKADLAAAEAHAAQAAASPSPAPHPTATDPLAPGDAFAIRAELALRRGDPKAAADFAAAALRRDPWRLQARLLAARAAAALGQFRQARDDVDLVLRAIPSHQAANYLRALLALHEGDFVAADLALRQLGTAIDDFPRGLFFVAVARLGTGHLAEAEAADATFLAAAPTDTGAAKLLAMIAIARAHPQQALRVLDAPPLAGLDDADTLDLRGRAQALTGNMQGAAGSFARASALAPKDSGILNRLAGAELHIGDVPAAEADLRRSLLAAPGQTEAAGGLVQAALLRGDLQAAAAAVAQLRRDAGDTEAAGVLAAQVQMAGLDMREAAATLRDVLVRFPGSGAAALTLARVELLQGNADSARAVLETRLATRPDDAQALEALLTLLFADHRAAEAVRQAEAAHEAAADNQAITEALADAYAKANQASRAVALLDRTSAGGIPRLDLLRAGLLAQAGRTAEAVAAFRTVIDRDPGNVPARLGLAGLLAATRQYEAARAALREGLARTPGNEAMLGALVGLDLRQNGLAAARATAAALAADSANLPAAFALPGDIEVSTGHMAAAATAYATALARAPTSALAAKAARAANAAGDRPRAIALLESWTAGHHRDSTAIAMLGTLYLEAGRLPDAAARFASVLAIDPANVTALNNLAWIRQSQGDLAAATSLAERAYFQSALPQTADTLGWILTARGDAATALPLLRAAAASRDPAALYHYAVALAATGDTAKARSTLHDALEPRADYPEKAEALKFAAKLK